MFESNYTCHFFRLWGYEEGKKGIQLQDALLGNMQNDFDAKFGDVCAEVGVRYFIIEFKADRKGFGDEVSSSGKIHRTHLYQHLKEDSNCRSISRQGHFGAYADLMHQLVFEPYAHCPAVIQNSSEIVSERLSEKTEAWQELNYHGWTCNFNEFYELVTKAEAALSEFPSGFFKEGLGIARAHLEEYVECMYQHLESVEDDSGETIIGAFSPATGEFVAFKGSLCKLINKLHGFFAEMKSSQTLSLTSRSSGPHA